MSKPEGESKFEQMRSRRHMLNNLGDNNKSPSKHDASLIGGTKPVKATKPISISKPEKKPKSDLKPINSNSSAFAKNAGKVMGLELDNFK